MGEFDMKEGRIYSFGDLYPRAISGTTRFFPRLAIAHAGRNIMVNNVPPGFVATERLEQSPVDVDAFAPMTPMKRPGRPENVAAAVAFLASEDADYITGHTLSVNGRRYLKQTEGAAG